MVAPDILAMDERESAAPVGRREQHKKRTRRALQQAALELFAKQGFDDTTTDEIAAKADVSSRTFFRYFPSKESVLFAGAYGWLKTFRKHFLAQPANLTDLEALHDTLVTHAPRVSRARSSFLLYEKAIASSPVLRGCVHDNLQDDIRALSEAIAERRSLSEPDERCTLVAAIVLMVYRRAITRWTAGPAKAELGKLITEEFELLLGEVPSLADTASDAAAS